MSNEKKTCWERGLIQPLGMAIGSTINLCGAITSLVISVNKDKVDPLPFICTAMFTSFLYVASNSYRSYQICKQPVVDTELKEIKIVSFTDKLEEERKEKSSSSLDRR